MRESKKRGARRWWPVLVFCAVMIGCVDTRIYPTDVADLSQVTASDVLLVGRFEFVPPIEPEEQDIQAGGAPTNLRSRYGQRIVLYPSSRPEVFAEDDYGWKNNINPPLEEPYFMVWPAKRPYIARGEVVTYWHSYWTYTWYGRSVVKTKRRTIELPTPITIDIRPNDYTLYVGTVRVFRDEDNHPYCITILDEYDDALKMGRERFGASFRMRRAPLQIGGPDTTVVKDDCREERLP